MRGTFQLLKHGLLIIGFLSVTNFAYAQEIKFGLPIKCEINKDCFIQNLPDIIEGKGASDSFCEGATYDGHKGLDIRLFSLEDIKRNVPVIASANGIIKAFRDGEPDKLILTQEDKAQIQNKECGNGIVISHPNGYESQYCHMKQNSIAIRKGQTVKQGDVLGFVGNSGLAQFPHIHLSIRKDGKWLDPISGNAPAQSCSLAQPEKPLLNEEALNYFNADSTKLIASGIAGNVIKHNELVKTGIPKKLVTTDQAIVGWAWFINLRKGDQIRFTLEGPKGTLAQNTTKPVDRHKATYSGFAGKKGKPLLGEYMLKTELIRDGKPMQETLYIQTLE